MKERYRVDLTASGIYHHHYQSVDQYIDHVFVRRTFETLAHRLLRNRALQIDIYLLTYLLAIITTV